MNTMGGALFEYKGEGAFEALTPAARRQADKLYVIGERYTLDPQELRNMAAHRFYFASINEAWSNLPEETAERFPSPDHLRRYALIKTGFCDERTIVCATNSEATKLAAYVRSMDGFAVIALQGNVVTAWTAQSQSTRAMGAERFKDSKAKVLAYLDQLLGVRPGDTQRAGEAA